jgi:hypothetical protein
VIVVDAKPIAGGESGRTSAHLASAIDDRFIEIEKRHGVEGSRIQYESHNAAIDQIERIVRDEQIDCDFTRLDGYLFLGGTDTPDMLDEELEAAKRAGFADAERLSEAPTKGFASGPCLRFPRQGRFQVLQYLAGLARRLATMGVRIRTGSFVADMSAENGRVMVRTREGQTITAKFGVAATNVPSPINNWAGIYTKVAPYRTYMVGLKYPKGLLADALYWDTPDPYHYARLETTAGGPDHDVLIVGGEDHKTGQHSSADEQEKHFRRPGAVDPRAVPPRRRAGLPLERAGVRAGRLRGVHRPGPDERARELLRHHRRQRDGDDARHAGGDARVGPDPRSAEPVGRFVRPGPQAGGRDHRVGEGEPERGRPVRRLRDAGRGVGRRRDPPGHGAVVRGG